MTARKFLYRSILKALENEDDWDYNDTTLTHKTRNIVLWTEWFIFTIHAPIEVGYFMFGLTPWGFRLWLTAHRLVKKKEQTKIMEMVMRIKTR